MDAEAVAAGVEGGNICITSPGLEGAASRGDGGRFVVDNANSALVENWLSCGNRGGGLVQRAMGSA